jgi:hypothetical protein
MSGLAEDLDQPCGAHFVFRDLIECGETWHRLADAREPGARVDNVPACPETFEAMRALCRVVLDPAVERFGRIELTYAFASASLTRQIPAHIHPPLDQHAGHERTRAGKPVCSRLGLAADFFVPGVDSGLVARWIVASTAFDRLYFYGGDRPIHVSVGPACVGQIVHMRRGASGRRVPQMVPASFFDPGGG